MKNAVLHGVNIRKFYGDAAFDANDLFDLAHAIGVKTVIKIRKNASTDLQRGSKYRRREVREYREKGYEAWAEQNRCGMRSPGTEGIFSAVKRKLGENCVGRSAAGLENEEYRGTWMHDHINIGGEEAVKIRNQ